MKDVKVICLFFLNQDEFIKEINDTTHVILQDEHLDAVKCVKAQFAVI